jgi:hypothetical protein
MTTQQPDSDASVREHTLDAMQELDQDRARPARAVCRSLYGDSKSGLNTVTRRLNAARRKGLVRRSKPDRWDAYHYALTPQGARVLKEEEEGEE